MSLSEAGGMLDQTQDKLFDLGGKSKGRMEWPGGYLLASIFSH